ncbi:RWD domain-containing protein 4 [Musca autumnalis]|uniref:RWD domain-containing protein 4 n=1 Tax=Musca autumnalis TaxID=221902 RepID=UPI003CF7BDAE
MSETLELQADEREALQSIYEGDEAFKEIDPTTFQYKYGEDDNFKSFLVEIKWGENYPNEMPTINMDTFYNRNLVPAVKQTIQKALQEEGEQWLGCGMTYTLFECLKERLDELTSEQPEHVATQSIDLDKVGVSAIQISDSTDNQKKEVKKEQLTKAQKRRQWEKTDNKGELPRGYNWVDIVKHLSQTGYKEEQKAANAANSSLPVSG